MIYPTESMSQREAYDLIQSGEIAYPKDITLSKQIAVHQAMMAEAKRLGLPVAYCRDLVLHDYREVLGKPSHAVFYWRIRQCGTQLSSTEDLVRAGWDNEQEHCYRVDIDTCTLKKL